MFLCRETKKSYNSQLRAACEAALQEIKESVGEQGEIGIQLILSFLYFFPKNNFFKPCEKKPYIFYYYFMRRKRGVSRKNLSQDLNLIF